MSDDDPNEAYEVVPIAPGPHGPPHTWWTVKRNGIPVRHLPRQGKGGSIRDRSRIPSKPCRREGVGEAEVKMKQSKPQTDIGLKVGDRVKLIAKTLAWKAEMTLQGKIGEVIRAPRRWPGLDPL